MVYNPITNVWSTAIEAMPAIGSSINIGVAVFNDVFYIIGGSLNYQYVPIGYGTISPVISPSAIPTQSNSLTTSESKTPKYPSNYLIATILIVIVSIIVTGLFFYSKRKKEEYRKYCKVTQLLDY